MFDSTIAPAFCSLSVLMVSRASPSCLSAISFRRMASSNWLLRNCVSSSRRRFSCFSPSNSTYKRRCRNSRNVIWIHIYVSNIFFILKPLNNEGYIKHTFYDAKWIKNHPMNFEYVFTHFEKWLCTALPELSGVFVFPNGHPIGCCQGCIETSVNSKQL